MLCNNSAAKFSKSLRPSSSRRPVVRSRANGGNGNNGNGRGRGNGGDSGSGDNNSPRGMRFSWMGLATLVGAGQLVLSGAAEARGKKEPAPPPPPEPEPIESLTEQLWTLVGPILTNLGFSGVLGLVSAISLKVIGKAFAVLIGLVFAGVQVMSYYGYISVNWSKVHSDVTTIIDQNNDGKLDHEDFKIFMSRGLGILAQGVPSVGGFCAGFMLGLKM